MRIHHLALRTRSLSRLEAFYVGVLGLSVVKRDASRSVWLDAGGTIVMLEAAEEHEPAISPGSHELVAFAATRSELTRFERTLEERAIAIEARTAFTVYFRDPDGRRVGLSCYPEA